MATPPIINEISAAATKAARSLLRDFNEVENLQISIKGPGDFVSAADKRAEKIIYEELLKAKPDSGFLMEESGEVIGKSSNRFIIDPLDGTTNFLHGFPHWCISIAYEQDGIITAGVVLDPVKDEMFYATKGGGAWMRGNKRLRVSGRTELNMCIISSSQIADQENIYKSLRPQVASIRNLGASALDLAYVASGRLDGYFDGFGAKKGPKSWDVAAGQLLVKEAGGKVSEINGQGNYVFNNNILAGNPDIHTQLKDILNS
jgi:myo-inositol-1(or 4)-monophosphatase